jgi:hypothetical protein
MSVRGWSIELVTVSFFFLLAPLLLATDRLAPCNAPLLTVGDEVSLLLHRAQDSGSGNLLSKSPEQALLRFSWSQFNLGQTLLTPLQM